MKLLKAGLLFAMPLLWLFAGTSAHAVVSAEPYVPPSKLEDSPVIISSYSFDAARVEYVQLFNTSDRPINLQDWQIKYFVAGQSEPLVLAEMSGWIAPSNYILAAGASISGSDFPYELHMPEIALPGTLRLVPSAVSRFAAEEIAFKNNGAYVRKTSATTGKYISGYSQVDELPSPLYGGGFYDFPEETSLQVSEMLPRPRKCPPASADGTCNEYVKLYNPSAQAIDLSQFRLRVGYKGQGATAANTYLLPKKSLAPGRYATISADADGRLLSLTDSGSFVWLEDTYGVKMYTGTMASYPSATSTAKEGAAWAYDERNGAWKWTARPAPGDGPSAFVSLPVKVKKAAATSQLKPCRSDQYRSKETDRCRSLASVSASSLTPCKPGQIRNPATNRCRGNATLAGSLKPCAANQERNPETNRCRKKASGIPGSAFAVEPVKETGKAFAGWWALGGVGVLAAGYGAWEWRQETAGAIRKVFAFATGRK